MRYVHTLEPIFTLKLHFQVNTVTLFLPQIATLESRQKTLQLKPKLTRIQSNYSVLYCIVEFEIQSDERFAEMYYREARLREHVDYLQFRIPSQYSRKAVTTSSSKRFLSYLWEFPARFIGIIILRIFRAFLWRIKFDQRSLSKPKVEERMSLQRNSEQNQFRFFQIS